MSQQKFPSYGGQALIEGVLMRGSYALAAAFRTPEGNIKVVEEELSGIYSGKLKRIPIIRGLILLWDALGLGSRFLTLSANLQSDEEKIEGKSLFFTYALSILIAVAVFSLFPAALGQLIERTLDWSPLVSNLLEGFIRLMLLIGYMWIIGKIPEISRVFAYHGAEHKTINAFEAGEVLKPENVKDYSVEHPRCGTGFLLNVVLISIIIFSGLGSMTLFWRLITRIVFIPVIAGLAYEYIRWTAKHLDNPVVRIISYPSLAIQKLTTREPDLDMLEVSIAAFKAMYAQELSKRKSPVSTLPTAVVSSDAVEDEYRSLQI